MTCLCGHRGFAGPSACVLEKGHEGDHKYGDYQQALAIAAAKELQSLRDQLAAAQADRDKLLAALVSVNESAVCFTKNEYAISADALNKVENCISSAATAKEQ